MGSAKLSLWVSLILAAASFWAGLWFAPDHPVLELERLEVAVAERQAELRTIEAHISGAAEDLRLATENLDQVKKELRATSSNLVERFQSEMSIAGLSEQDICEEYAEVYFQDQADNYCSDKFGEPYEP
ncbi:MAG TPA: hypothetical protein PKA03_09855 [Tabrizicola sp.]|nr:hypothetical protein [Tabrizicola sp.]